MPTNKWDEKKHPRNHGKFAPKGGGSSGKAADKPKGKQAPAKKPAAKGKSIARSAMLAMHDWAGKPITTKTKVHELLGHAGDNRGGTGLSEFLQDHFYDQVDQQHIYDAVHGATKDTTVGELVNDLQQRHAGGKPKAEKPAKRQSVINKLAAKIKQAAKAAVLPVGTIVAGAAIGGGVAVLADMLEKLATRSRMRGAQQELDDIREMIDSKDSMHKIAKMTEKLAKRAYHETKDNSYATVVLPTVTWAETIGVRHDRLDALLESYLVASFGEGNVKHATHGTWYVRKNVKPHGGEIKPKPDDMASVHGHLTQNRRPGQAVKYEVRRAPKPSGVTIAGKHYKPGMFIPGDAMAKATPQQKAAIDQGQSPPGEQGAKPAEKPATGPQTRVGLRVPPSEGVFGAPTTHNLARRLAGMGMLRGAKIGVQDDTVIVKTKAGGMVRVRWAREGELQHLLETHGEAARASARAGGIEEIADIAGVYRDGTVILNSDVSAGEINHEMLHALQDLGIITDKEIQAFGGHEQMAYAYQSWVDQGMPGKHGVLHRIADFFRSLFGDDRATQRRIMRTLASGSAIRRVRGEKWAKAAFYATLTAYGLEYMGKVLKPVSQPLYGVRSDMPETAIGEDGTINASRLLFATREWKRWADKFEADKRLDGIYSANDRKEFVRGLAWTAAIFGDFSKLPEEATKDEKGKPLSPIRKNADPLFKDTFDLSTICPKQDQFVAIVNAVQNGMNLILSKNARNLVNEMLDSISALGLMPACFYCYGQASRNAAAEGVDKVSRIWKDVSESIRTGQFNKIMALQPGQKVQVGAETKSREQLLKDLFQGWSSVKKTKTTDASGNEVEIETTQLLASAIKKYHKNVKLSQMIVHRPNELHDYVMGYKQTPKEFKPAVDEIRKVVQGGMKPNMPQGWASYTDQVFSTPKTGPHSIEAFNKSAGFRMNSQSDFRPWHLMDTAQFLAHLGAKKGMAHAYTRSPEFVEIFGDTGMKFNLSCSYAHDASGRIMKDAKGAMWSSKSFPQEKARQFRQRYAENVGAMLVPLTVEDIVHGLDDPEIDMMIPYHAGSVPKSVDEFQGAMDFSAYQHEEWGQWKDGEVRKVKTLDGRRLAITREQPLTREHHKNDKAIYLDICKQLRITPRFPQLCGHGHLAQHTNKGASPTHPLNQVNIDHPNYMKLVRDVAREPSKQKPVNIRKINWKASENFLFDYLGKGGYDAETQADPIALAYVKDRIKRGAWPKQRGELEPANTADVNRAIDLMPKREPQPRKWRPFLVSRRASGMHPVRYSRVKSTAQEFLLAYRRVTANQ